MQLTLRTARTRKRLSAGKLARLAGVNKSTISRLEHGLTAPLHETVQKLEEVMELDPGTLKFSKSASV